MTVSTSSPTESAESAEATGHRAPRADCVVDAAGDITFTLAASGAPATELVLRRRGEDTADEVRLPLTASDDGRSRADLPRGTELAEGRWDACTESGDAIEPGIRDVRTLLDQVPDSGPVRVRIPYPTADGRLALRCWVRSPHAEAGEIGIAPEQGAMTVEGRLYGTRLGEGAVAEARLRSGDAVHTVPVTGADGAFVFTLPYAPIAEASGGADRWWDLWLRPAADAAATRISRILDDVWDKKSIFVYPAQATATSQVAAPYYTGDNDLCIRLTAAS